ncbi:MAG: biotin transporter BioY [Pseudobutyrivibrio sp.]|nr:biotin transporter BioY [Pseudobutyrivibrio sp.]
MTKMKTYELVIMALFAALMCIFGPLSLPIGPVPISLTTLVIYIASGILGTKKATVSCIIYLLLGIVGLPVFSGFSGGLAKLAGPTGGYLIGYIPLAAICGVFFYIGKNKWYVPVLGMIIGTTITYTLGTIWFMLQMDMGLMESLTLCVIPFLIGDGIKVIVATVLVPAIRKPMIKAGLIQ